MSLDISNTSGTGAGTLDDDPSDGLFSSLPPHMSAYVGFSAQSFSIPSIACDSDLSLTPSNLSPAVERLKRLGFQASNNFLDGWGFLAS